MRFGNSQRGDIVQKSMSELPGPGNYNNVNEFGKDVKPIAIRGKPKDLKPSDIPGPGSYDANDTIVKGISGSVRMG